MKTEIKIHIRIENGRLISEKNMHKIRCESLRVQRGHDSSWKPYFDPATYKETWVVRKHPKKGFIFLEVKHGGGISGFHKSLRSLVISSASSDRRIVVSNEPIEITPDGERRIQQTLTGNFKP